MNLVVERNLDLKIAGQVVSLYQVFRLVEVCCVPSTLDDTLFKKSRIYPVVQIEIPLGHF